jgi:hypothetical protein
MLSLPLHYLQKGFENDLLFSFKGGQAIFIIPLSFEINCNPTGYSSFADTSRPGFLPYPLEC